MNNELYICGRIKDVIIVRGVNMYPQDIEAIIEQSHALVKQGCCAAFGVTDSAGNEAIGVAVEVQSSDLTGSTLSDVADAVASCLNNSYRCSPNLIALLSPRTICKTSSGKIQRNKTKISIVDGSMPVLYLKRYNNAPQQTQEVVQNVVRKPKPEILPQKDIVPLVNRLPKTFTRSQITRAITAVVLECAKEVLDVDDVVAMKPLLSIGLDSLSALELRNKLQAKFGVELSVTLVFENETLADITERIVDIMIEVARSREPDVSTENTECNTDGSKPGARIKYLSDIAITPRAEIYRKFGPLSSQQLQLFTLHQQNPLSTAYNECVYIVLRGKVDFISLASSVNNIIERHEILRSRFVFLTENEDLTRAAGLAQYIAVSNLGADEPVQTILAESDHEMTMHDLRHMSGNKEAQERAVQMLLKQEASRPFNLSKDNLLRVCVIKRDNDETILSVCVPQYVMSLDVMMH